ncbi:uncharacterized protein A4U43_C07F23110 [Asparagus officinalis]|uniref:Uncharacterized protein n=1 Tax=Asparagus officinalis TaxID=4686 RepID=A0A5P1EG61_ASPOF|nr:uncharacterized protein A4U43_C07F23110 [Asparagus officinalis]
MLSDDVCAAPTGGGRALRAPNCEWPDSSRSFSSARGAKGGARSSGRILCVCTLSGAAWCRLRAFIFLSCSYGCVPADWCELHCRAELRLSGCLAYWPAIFKCSGLYTAAAAPACGEAPHDCALGLGRCGRGRRDAA